MTFNVCCEWGLEGISSLQSTSEVFVIIDVLSFSTCVDIAAAAGARIYPYRWQDERAATYALSVQAELVLKGIANPHGYALSPASLLNIPAGTSLVLPSPNGSTLSLETGDVPTFTACLRNAAAVASLAQRTGRRIGVIPAGERWGNGNLRFALEDLIGAGAVIACLRGSRSPEAELAVAAYLRFQDNLSAALKSCLSGIELIDRGRTKDLELSAMLNVSQCAPQLSQSCYTC
jgi:2-phosphosulfolactate phosphatase